MEYILPMILQAKLDIGETSGCQGSKMIILNKGITLEKKGFYSKKTGRNAGMFS